MLAENAQARKRIALAQVLRIANGLNQDSRRPPISTEAVLPYTAIPGEPIGP